MALAVPSEGAAGAATRVAASQTPKRFPLPVQIRGAAL